jgi:hypothetical protein
MEDLTNPERNDFDRIDVLGWLTAAIVGYYCLGEWLLHNGYITELAHSVIVGLAAIALVANLLHVAIEMRFDVNRNRCL